MMQRVEMKMVCALMRINFCAGGGHEKFTQVYVESSFEAAAMYCKAFGAEIKSFLHAVWN